MTSEVLIMNRQSLSLAADSAVTTGGGGHDPLVTLEAEKLFQIGEHVALMVYNRGDLIGRSWSQIAEAFVSKHGLKSYASVEACADALFAFMENNRSLFPEAEEKVEFQSMAAYLFSVVEEHARFMVEDASSGVDDTLQAIDTAVAVYIHHLELNPDGSARDANACFANLSEQAFTSQHGKEIESVIHAVFQQYSLPKATRDRLVHFIWLTVTRDVFVEPYTGMVIAGFGSDDTFPTAELHVSSFMVDGKLKRMRMDRSAVAGLDGPRAIVRTFAQADMTHTFMRGIHPFLLEQVTDLAFIASEEAARTALNEAEVDEVTIKRVMETMSERHLPAIAAQYEHYIHMLAHSQFTDPVLSVIEASGKRQVAEIAKVLVELNIIRDELHQHQRGVGGAVDVAMITRKGGFEWHANKNGG
jgi:hypothetical protein